MRIAYLEDDPDQANLMTAWMQEAGYQYQHFDLGGKFVNRISKDSFDCIILDWEIPDLTGLEVLSWIRNNYDVNIPVIFVTQRQEEEDIVEALEAGADDYLVKPVRQGEFMARLRALYRRSSDYALKDDVPLEVTPYKFNKTNETISLHGEPVKLTKKEYDLALFLFKNIGRVISRDHIMESVWGKYSDLNTRTVDTHVSRIRSKLNISEENGWRLTSIYMHGYRLDQLS